MADDEARRARGGRRGGQSGGGKGKGAGQLGPLGCAPGGPARTPEVRRSSTSMHDLSNTTPNSPTWVQLPPHGEKFSHAGPSDFSTAAFEALRDDWRALYTRRQRDTHTRMLSHMNAMHHGCCAYHRYLQTFAHTSTPFTPPVTRTHARAYYTVNSDPHAPTTQRPGRGALPYRPTSLCPRLATVNRTLDFAQHAYPISHLKSLHTRSECAFSSPQMCHSRI